MAKLLSKAQLPHLHSTRDTRDRLDLVKPEMDLGATRISADRILYHPGDTAAAHYHTGCYHLFYILEGQGLMFVDGSSHRMSAGMIALVAPGETHWFENDTQENFSFVEFWAPPPDETVWVTDDC
jgi:mannose-6-phosphate isomerase-like protein (cupin superfamily)